ncbi:MAG: hypothetical protein ACREOH_09060 [Candidatus Entotheonellia bacterium]
MDGEVEVEVVGDPRPHNGEVVPRLTDRGPLGYHCEHRAEALVLHSAIPLMPSEGEPGTRYTLGRPARAFRQEATAAVRTKCLGRHKKACDAEKGGKA